VDCSCKDVLIGSLDEDQEGLFLAMADFSGESNFGQGADELLELLA
jgi:hypothetical protein